MTIRVLVVDDSFFFCQMVGKLLNNQADIEIVGFAHTGMEAIQKVGQLNPDVVTLDVEMPVMDGITALKEIKKQSPTTKVLMFSSLTYEGAKLTLDALEFGAVDFLLKSYEDVSRPNSRTGKVLIEKVLAIGGSSSSSSSARSTPQTPSSENSRWEKKPPQSHQTDSKDTGSTANTASAYRAPQKDAKAVGQSVSSESKSSVQVRSGARIKPGSIKIVVIGSSTGGPVALQGILTKLPANFPVPIVIAQHMPEAFTGAFSERLNSLCQMQVKEAKQGDILRPGVVYIAPGGKQLMIEGNERQMRIRIHAGDTRLNYQPSVDVTFGSVARLLGDKVLAIILTGMGADGREGARLLKSRGSHIWSQDEASSVIYGMPMAVAKAGLSDKVLALNDFATHMIQEVR